MEYAEIINEAVGTLTVNKLRTALATLGIVIGISSVIALISLGQSGQKAVEAQIQSLGSNLLTVIPGAIRPGDIRSASGTSTTLTWDDAKALSKSQSVQNIKNVSPELLRRSQVVTGRKNTNTQILGVTPQYLEVRNVNLQSGVFISQKNLEEDAKVAILGPQVVSDLFGDSDPLNQTIRINNLGFRVIGTTSSKGASGFSNQDDLVFIPLSTAQKLTFGVDYIGSVSIQVDDPQKMDEVRDQVGYFLLARHKIHDPQNADFTIFSQNDILGAASQVTSTFTALLSGIAAISLLVGGIGIMNIMLVTVTERTREIGLRKALGAKKRIITIQFLIESIILTLGGGIIGVFLGILASYFISTLIGAPFVLSIPAVLLAFVVSAAIGIIFGAYPARKAANLQPIEALRYE